MVIEAEMVGVEAESMDTDHEIKKRNRFTWVLYNEDNSIMQYEDEEVVKLKITSLNFKFDRGQRKHRYYSCCVNSNCKTSFRYYSTETIADDEEDNKTVYFIESNLIEHDHLSEELTRTKSAGIDLITKNFINQLYTSGVRAP